MLSTLIAGFVVWGGIGWLLDHWWGTRLMTPLGLLIGMGLGIYAVVKRFGSSTDGSATSTAKPGSTTKTPLDRSTGSTSSTPPRTTSGIAAVPPTAPSHPGQPPAGTRRETECP